MRAKCGSLGRRKLLAQKRLRGFLGSSAKTAMTPRLVVLHNLTRQKPPLPGPGVVRHITNVRHTRFRLLRMDALVSTSPPHPNPLPQIVRNKRCRS